MTQILIREHALLDGARAILQDEPRERRVRLPRMRLARRHQGPAPGHLRERHQARHLGDDTQAGRRATSSPPTPFPSWRTWSDFALEDQGRLTEPLVYDAATDRYVPIAWQDAFDWSAATLRGARKSKPGRLLHLRAAGQRSHLPLSVDGPRVRHEQPAGLLQHVPRGVSGRALQAALGTGKGTVDLKDWETADALFIMGVNAASNAPRMLTALAEAYRRGAQIVHINPLVEAAATRTIVPHEFDRDGAVQGDPRPARSTCSCGSAATWRCCAGSPRRCWKQSRPDRKALDREFIERHTQGFEDYRALCEATSWAELERQSGLTRGDIVKAAEIYSRSDRTLISWCLGAHPARTRGRHRPRDRQPAAAARQPGQGRSRALARARPQQRSGQSHLRHRPPSRPSSSSTGWPTSATSTRRATHGMDTVAVIKAMQRRTG